MSRGGSRNRSGPQADFNSARSERRGIKLTALPSGGRTGPPPTFPLQPIVLFMEYFEGTGKDRTKIRERDEGETGSFREREADVWAEAWTTPQAIAWEREAWRWPVVAEYCRLKTVVEFNPGASAALVAQLHRYRDQIGLTPAGLKENGWAVSVDEIAAKSAENDETTSEPATKPERRMRAVSSGGS